MNLKKCYQKVLFTSGAVTVLTVLILIIVMKYNDITPFGNNSFACMDGVLQYLDFFAYYKDLISGHSSLVYTLTSGLGGSTIGLFAYYLASPFNLLLRFVDHKENLNLFFSLLVLLKMATSGVMMNIYLNCRFQQKIKSIYVVLLSLSYALMQYNFAQACDIMWLDGVYMLPLVLLGVYYSANKNKTTFLSIVVAISIFFNWYTAGIDCLYSIPWFFMELYIANAKEKLTKHDVIKRCAGFFMALAVGVMISSLLFIPNFYAMRSGKGTLDWDSFKITFNGNILSTVLRYSIGSISDQTACSLFCGCFALLGAIGFFTCTQTDRKIKRAVGIIAAFSVFIFYWQPLFLIFSLFKNATSYWFRYSYVSIFCLIFTAGFFYAQWESVDNINRLFNAALMFSFLLLLLKFATNDLTDISFIYYTSIICIVESLVLICLKGNLSRIASHILPLLLACVSAFELYINGELLAGIYQEKNIDQFQNYEKLEEEQIAAIKNKDGGLYRINQTSTRKEQENNITANYNESLAFGYNGIASYTSSPLESELDFLDKLGYRKEFNSISVVNTSIVPVDSLLGVKYVLSKNDINGYKKIPSLPVSADEKYVYENPYALPLAFMCNGENSFSLSNDPDLNENNPFTYVNDLYSKIVNEKVKVFYPIKSEREDNEGEIIFRLSDIKNNDPVYGNIPGLSNATINVNDQYTQDYGCWLSPSVFYIPTNNSTAELQISASDSDAVTQEPQFYACDLSVMDKIKRAITKNKATINSYADGEFNISAIADSDNEKLILSIPYNNGWKIQLNGKKVNIESFEDSLMQIPLDKGVNNIKFKYYMPGFREGVLGTFIGILLLLIMNHRSILRCINPDRKQN